MGQFRITPDGAIGDLVSIRYNTFGKDIDAQKLGLGGVKPSPEIIDRLDTIIDLLRKLTDKGTK